MTPFFFGSSSRRLFGIYEPAGSTPMSVHRTAVLCHAWGQEYLRSHRSMRRLGNMLSIAGWNVLRFDYFGTGDSDGNMQDADLAGWKSDIETAIEEARDTSGAKTIALIGLRLGGSLAHGVASRPELDVAALVLWDPVLNGKAFLAELSALEQEISGAAPRKRPSEVAGGHEILGFAMTTAMANEIQAIDLNIRQDSLPSRNLTIVSHARGSANTGGTAGMPHTASALGIEFIPSSPAWLEDRHTGVGAIPVNALQRIVEWLE